MSTDSTGTDDTPTDRSADDRGRVLAARLLAEGLVVRVQVHGISMWPSLSSGAEVELEPLATSPEPGDIVLTDRHEEGQRLHRVSRLLEGAWVQTRGDACLRLDTAVPPESVLGRVRRVRSRTGVWRRCAPAGLSRLLACLLLNVSRLALVLRLAPEAPRTGQHPG